MTESEMKAAFAAFLLETPDQPFAAALKLFPSDRDRGEACRITFAWPNDPEVMEEIARLQESGYGQKKPPTKAELIQMALDVYNHAFTSPKEKNAAIKLIADLQGMIVKAETLDINSRRMPSAPVYKIVTE